MKKNVILIFVTSLTISIEAQQSNALLNAFKNLEQHTSLKISPLESELFRFYSDEFTNLRFLEISTKFLPEKIPAFVNEIEESNITGITIYLDSLSELNPELFNVSQLSRVTIIENNSSAHIKNDFNMVMGNGKNIKVEYYSNKQLQPNDGSFFYNNLPNCKVYYQEKEIMSEWFDYNRKYSNIKPLVEKKYFEGTYAYINSERDTILELLNGASINIPANSLIDKSGNKVTGKVRVDYTEYKTPFDIFASGIPMEFKTDSGTFNLYSGGMFELLASKNGEELFLEKNKEITLNFEVTDNQNYNLYAFNDNENNWNLRETEVTSFIDNSIIINYDNWITDSASLDEKFYDQNYFYIWKINAEDKRWNWLFKNRISTGKINKHKMVDIALVKKSERGGVWFKIKHRNTTDESRVFNNYYWYSLNCTSKKDFKKRYIKRRLYSDMLIEYDKNQKKFTVLLKDPLLGIVELPCEPRNKKYLNQYEELTEKQLDRIDMKQSKIRERREYRLFYGKTYYNSSNSIARDGIEASMVKSIKKQGINTFRNDRSSLTKEELSMNKQQFLNHYYKKVRKEYVIKNQIRTPVYNSSVVKRNPNEVPLKLNGFGVWNCDRIEKFKEPILVNINFKEDSVNSINSEIAYVTVIDKKNRGVINYGNTNFMIDGSSNYALFIRNGDGKLAAVPYKNIIFNKKGEYEFPIVWSEDNVSYSDLKKMTGL